MIPSLDFAIEAQHLRLEKVGKNEESPKLTKPEMLIQQPVLPEINLEKKK